MHHEISCRRKLMVSPVAQRGAALFVSLMILILLSILALSAAQVTGLQARMAGIYRSDFIAFESAESTLRQREGQVRLSDNTVCQKNDADKISSWKDNPGSFSDGDSTVRNMAIGQRSRGFGWRGSSQAGVARAMGDIHCAYFSVAAIDHDSADSRTSTAIVQSVFTP